MRVMFGIVALLLTSFATTTVWSQEGPKPGKEHEFLKQHGEGEWTLHFGADASAPAIGTTKNKMTMGGLWLMCDADMTIEGAGKFTGHGMDSYDPVKKKYVGLWIDSMITSPINYEGELSADGKTMTCTGKGPSGMDGSTVDYKMVTEYKDKNTHTFKMWSGELTGEPMLTLTYVRKK
jgi:hypothetical protein